jgi:hypothetical protein
MDGYRVIPPERDHTESDLTQLRLTMDIVIGMVRSGDHSGVVGIGVWKARVLLDATRVSTCPFFIGGR